MQLLSGLKLSGAITYRSGTDPSGDMTLDPSNQFVVEFLPLVDLCEMQSMPLDQVDAVEITVSV